MPRTVEVPAGRLAGWLERFEQRHGALQTTVSAEEVGVTAEDGSVAVLAVPYPPLRRSADDRFGGIVAHALAERRVGVLLVRRGGYAVGVFVGDRLVASKVGRRHVQGRSAAGGWSQQRFARRRDQQAREAAGAAAEVAARILLPEVAAMRALVTGGDREMVEAVLDDRRLAGLRPLVVDRLLPVPDPRRDVLEKTLDYVRGVRIAVADPAPPDGD